MTDSGLSGCGAHNIEGVLKVLLDAPECFSVQEYGVIIRNRRWNRWKRSSGNRGSNNMETKYYIVARIDGDYAWLNRTDAEEEPLFIARALLPEAIDEGTKLKYEMLQYEVIQD